MTFTAAVRYSGGLCVYNFAGNIFVVLMFAFDVRACVYVCIGIEHSILSRIMYFFRLSFAFFGVERSNDTLLLCRIFSLVSSEKREKDRECERDKERPSARESQKYVDGFSVQCVQDVKTQFSSTSQIAADVCAFSTPATMAHILTLCWYAAPDGCVCVRCANVETSHWRHLSAGLHWNWMHWNGLFLDR